MTVYNLTEGERLPARTGLYPSVEMSDLMWEQVIHELRKGNKSARRLADKIDARVQYVRGKDDERRPK